VEIETRFGALGCRKHKKINIRASYFQYH